MKKKDSNHQAELVNTADNRPKDKRMLVLWLFGIIILTFNLMPKKEDKFAHQYHLVRSNSGSAEPILTQIQEVKTGLGMPGDSHRSPIAQGSSPGRLTALDDTPCKLAFFFNLPLRINEADLEALSMLPGVGGKLAKRIHEHRVAIGRFSGPNDLLEVSGIGRKSLEKLTPLLSFN